MAGIGLLTIYSASPGKESHPPKQWPASSTLRRSIGVSTLIMFVHPKCPCSQASIGELALLLAHSAGTLRAQIIFLQPEGKDGSWMHTDLWQAASKLPMTVVVGDFRGREAELFTAVISGETMVYDAEGKLQFHGGITGSRGHAGDNAGYASLESFANGSGVSKVQTPVFGCPLFDQKTCATP